MRRLHCFVGVLYVLILLGSVSTIGLRLDQPHQPLIDSHISSLLPAELVEPRAEALKQRLAEKFSGHFVVFVASDSDEEALVYARDLQSYFQTSAVVEPVKTMDVGVVTEVYEPYRYQLLRPEFRQQLTELSSKKLAQLRFNELFSPAGGRSSSASFSEDPFNLTSGWVSGLLTRTPVLKPTEIPSVKAGGDTWYIVQGQLRADAMGVEAQALATPVLDEFYSASTSVRLKLSGLMFHAANGAQLARHEISTMGLVSTISVVLILLAFFRSVLALALIVTTMLSSVLIGFAVNLWVFSQVHIITLIFGATLLGLVVDYCFHFLVKYQTLGQPTAAFLKIRKGLVIGVSTSVLAYSLQLFTPFPGLQQFAVFIGSGLIAAGLHLYCVVWMFPVKPTNVIPLAKPCYRFFVERGLARLITPKKLSLGGFILLMLVTFLVASLRVNDNIGSMNTSDARLLTSEAFVRSSLGGQNTQQFVTVDAASEEQLLQRLTQFEKLVVSELDVRHPTSLARYVPSGRTQRQDYDLVNTKLYGANGALVHLCELLKIDCNNITKPQGYVSSINISDVQPHLMDYFPAVNLFENDLAVVLLPSLNQESVIALKSLAEKLEGVNYVDETAKINQLLRDYRVQSGMLLALFVGALLLVCGLLFGRVSVKIFVAPVMSVGLALALVSPTGLSLFHVLAALLVLGLAVDASGFYYSAGFNVYTWWACSLSAVTSLLVFGILMFSSVPMLSDFGQVLFVGLTCSILISPLVFYKNTASEK